MKAGDIVIKDINVLRGLMERNFHPLLINIILSVAEKHGVFITESYRDKRHMGDLHGVNPVRAIDIRWWAYTEILANRIAKEINRTWEYDPDRPFLKCAVIHDAGSGVHFHIQVSNKTRRIQ